MRIGFLASGGGTNMQAIIDACESGELAAKPVVMIGNNSKANCFERARRHGIPTVHISGTTHPDPHVNDRAVRDALANHKVELVCLVGYMKQMGPETLAAFPGRILNIHPGLLPKHGGAGMYGDNVHASVLAAGDTESGVTVHFVSDVYDEGPIIAQTRVPVLAGDDVKSLAARVLAQGHLLYKAVLKDIIEGRIPIPPLPVTS